MFELIIIWITGEKESYTYTNIDDAENAATGYKKAFGHQITFTCINKRN